MNWNAARYGLAGVAELSLVVLVWMFVGQTVASTHITAQMTGPLVCLGTMVLGVTGPGLALVWLSAVDVRASVRQPRPTQRSAAA